MVDRFSILVSQIHSLTHDASTQTIDWLVKQIQKLSDSKAGQYHAALLDQIASHEIRAHMRTIFEIWDNYFSDMHPDALALAIQSAANNNATEYVELVWTGPNKLSTATRHSGEVLIELINHAQETLHIVSFAVYRYKPLEKVLLKAVERGVKISLYLETGKDSEMPHIQDVIPRFSPKLINNVNVYYWPIDKRIENSKGKIGSLHAKIAIADDDMLFISSANMTEYALTINVEAGVLFHDGMRPMQIISELEYLVEKKIFQKVEN